MHTLRSIATMVLSANLYGLSIGPESAQCSLLLSQTTTNDCRLQWFYFFVFFLFFLLLLTLHYAQRFHIRTNIITSYRRRRRIKRKRRRRRKKTKQNKNNNRPATSSDERNIYKCILSVAYIVYWYFTETQIFSQFILSFSVFCLFCAIPNFCISYKLFI